jgi:rare lipoprotein A
MRIFASHDLKRQTGLLLVCCLTLAIVGCSTTRPDDGPGASAETSSRPAPKVRVEKNGTAAPVLPAAGSGRGGYYLDDGPGDAPPPDLLATPDATPKVEPYSIRGNKPYVVFGKTYAPVTDDSPLKQRGIGSWYGKKFQGQKTSSGELYDMYKMTAAHPTLPIPSYARVTNLRNGAQVIVRVNDRGPFHSSRIIDLSYTAALKLGYLGHGSSELEVERLLPDEIARINSATATSSASAEAVVVPLPPQVQSVQPAQALSLEDYLKTQASKDAQESIAPVSSMSISAEALPLNADTLTAVTPTSSAVAVANTSLPNGFYLQFGAYSRSANAEAVKERLLQRWPQPVPAPEVRRSGAFYRLYSGPFTSRNDALEAARLLPDAGTIRPLIVQR